MFRLSFFILILTILRLNIVRGCHVGKDKGMRREHSVSQIPFIAYLQLINHHQTARNNPMYHAAGTIIAANVVLTRAYFCEVAPIDSFSVGAGHSYKPEGHTMLRVDEVAIHPDRGRQPFVKDQNLDNYVVLYKADLCVLRLKSYFFFAEGLQPAALPLPNDPLDPEEKLVSGWGDYSNPNSLMGRKLLLDGPQYDYTLATLFHIFATVLSPEDCRKSFDNAKRRLGKKVNFPIELHCLSGICEEEKSMLGDDGGPVYSPTKLTVEGIVVTVLDMTDDSAQFFTPLSPFVNWIFERKLQWATRS